MDGSSVSNLSSVKSVPAGLVGVPAERELVSIITPAFNAARLIRQTIGSVLTQTHDNWEMLVIDDGSSDDTREVVRELAARDRRIRLIEHSANRGVAQARNTGLQAASSPVVAFLDSDDLWLPQKLERQIQYMKSAGAGFTYTAFRRINEDGSQVGKLRPLPQSLGYRELLKNTAIVTSSVLIDRRQTGDFRLIDTNYEDFATWLSILRRGLRARAVCEDLVRYRVSKRGLSGNKLRSARWIWGVYRNTERLAMPDALWCFTNYACRAYWKRRTL